MHDLLAVRKIGSGKAVHISITDFELPGQDFLLHTGHHLFHDLYATHEFFRTGNVVHGIDSYKLLVEVNKQAAKAGKVVNCLLQLHIAEEETKFGFSFGECREMLAAGEWKTLSNIQLCGLMGMATNTDDNEQIEKEFCSLSSFFKEVKDSWFADTEAFRELSMGMSHDYHQAIAAGSTLIRVGSKIFGDRTY